MKRNNTLYNKTNPIVLRIINDSNENLNWVIFGSNKFLSSHNFGNHSSIKIENLTTHDSSYGELLQELSNSDIKVGLMRFWSDKKSNIHQTLTHHKIYNNVRCFAVDYEERSLNLSIMLNPYQFQSDIIDAPVEFEITNNTHFSGYIQKNSYIIITLYLSRSKANNWNLNEIIKKIKSNLHNFILKFKNNKNK